MNFRKQVFSLPEEYVVVNFHMVPDKFFFHFISIVVHCFLKSVWVSLHFCPLGNELKPPSNS